MKSLRDKSILITGGARGIGFAIAQRLGRDGARIALADLDAAELDRARDNLEQEEISCAVFPLDVTDIESIAAFRGLVHEGLGPIEVLVNNAGVVFGGPFLDLPLDKHLLTYRVNVEGLVAMTYNFLPDLVAADESHLVNIGSASALVGLPWGSTYASSKWAVLGFSESIRQEMNELGHQHVGVTTVCPGYVDTGMFEGVKPPLLMPFLKPDQLVDKVRTAILRRQDLVMEPWLVKLTPFLKGVLPRFLSDGLADLMGVTTGMKSWSGHANEPKDPAP
jgi:NAD(P)-dependent dehydrogenase (short-subunit alcohol dehydrogenase family)